MKPTERTYRHFGSSEFVKEKMTKVTKTIWIKPAGGLWASPIDSDRTWDEFCEDEDFRTKTLKNYFDFKLTPSAKIYVINTVKDWVDFINQFRGSEMDDLTKSYFDIYSFAYDCEATFNYFPDFVKAAEIYDGVEVNISNHYGLHYAMDGWDVDSIVVWNPDVVVTV